MGKGSALHIPSSEERRECTSCFGLHTVCTESSKTIEVINTGESVNLLEGKSAICLLGILGGVRFTETERKTETNCQGLASDECKSNIISPIYQI